MGDQCRECSIVLILFIAGVKRVKVGEHRVESFSAWIQLHISEQGWVPVDMFCAADKVMRKSKVNQDIA
jgi:hypothetical protein